MELNKVDNHIQENNNFVKGLGLMDTHTTQLKTVKTEKRESRIMILNKAATVNGRKQNFSVLSYC